MLMKLLGIYVLGYVVFGVFLAVKDKRAIHFDSIEISMISCLWPIALPMMLMSYLFDFVRK